MVARLLNIKTPPFDAGDALAMAISGLQGEAQNWPQKKAHQNHLAGWKVPLPLPSQARPAWLV